jgi:hypothetical protein
VKNDRYTILKLQRKELEQDRGEVLRILEDGAKRAREVAGETMAQVRAAMHLP